MELENEIVAFRLPTRSQTDESTIKYCFITENTTLDDLDKFLVGEFKAGVVMKMVWGQEVITLEKEKKVMQVIRDLRNKTGDTFNHKNTLVATFNFIGGQA